MLNAKKLSYFCHKCDSLIFHIYTCILWLKIDYFCMIPMCLYSEVLCCWGVLILILRIVSRLKHLSDRLMMTLNTSNMRYIRVHFTSSISIVTISHLSFTSGRSSRWRNSIWNSQRSLLQIPTTNLFDISLASSKVDWRARVMVRIAMVSISQVSSRDQNATA